MFNKSLKNQNRFITVNDKSDTNIKEKIQQSHHASIEQTDQEVYEQNAKFNQLY